MEKSMNTLENQTLKTVKLLLLDVDGVLTRGEIIYGDDDAEIKIFNVRDGLGLRLLMAAGIGVGIVTGPTLPGLVAPLRESGHHAPLRRRQGQGGPAGEYMPGDAGQPGRDGLHRRRPAGPGAHGARWERPLPWPTPMSWSRPGPSTRPGPRAARARCGRRARPF